MGNFKSLKKISIELTPHVWQVIIQLFLSGFTKNWWPLERPRGYLLNGTNLAFLAQFVKKLQEKQGLSKKWTNWLTCSLRRNKMSIFQKFPNQFFHFWSGFAQKYIYNGKNIVSGSKHFLKVIPASKTPCRIRAYKMQFFHTFQLERDPQLTGTVSRQMDGWDGHSEWKLTKMLVLFSARTY